MSIDFCNETQHNYWTYLFLKPRDMDPKPIYFYLCPVMIIVCFLSIIFNAILMSISRQSKYVNKSPILLLSLNLAVTDIIASLLNGLGILFNSLLPEVFDIKISQCQMLTFEAFRCTALVASALHLLALALVHYKGIVNPLHYRSTIFFSQHLSRTINVISIGCWIIPLTIIIVWFSSTPCQGFQAPDCDFLFLLGSTYRYMLLTVFAVPLLLMSIIYLRIFIIISRHQKGRRINHERSTLTRGVIKAAGHIGTASAAVDLPDLISSAKECQASEVDNVYVENNDPDARVLVCQVKDMEDALVVGGRELDEDDVADNDELDDASKCSTCAALLASKRLEQQQAPETNRISQPSAAASPDANNTELDVSSGRLLGGPGTVDVAGGDMSSFGSLAISGTGHREGEAERACEKGPEGGRADIGMREAGNTADHCNRDNNQGPDPRGEGPRFVLSNASLVSLTTRQQCKSSAGAARLTTIEPIEEDQPADLGDKTVPLAGHWAQDNSFWPGVGEPDPPRPERGLGLRPSAGVIFEEAGPSCQIVVAPSENSSTKKKKKKNDNNNSNPEELIKDSATTSNVCDKFNANELLHKRQRGSSEDFASAKLKDETDNERSSGGCSERRNCGSSGPSVELQGRQHQDRTLAQGSDGPRQGVGDASGPRVLVAAEAAAAGFDDCDSNAALSKRQHSKQDSPRLAEGPPMSAPSNAANNDKPSSLCSGPAGAVAPDENVAGGECELTSLPHGHQAAIGASLSGKAAEISRVVASTANNSTNKRHPLRSRFSLDPGLEAGQARRTLGSLDDESPSLVLVSVACKTEASSGPSHRVQLAANLGQLSRPAGDNSYQSQAASNIDPPATQPTGDSEPATESMGDSLEGPPGGQNNHSSMGKCTCDNKFASTKRRVKLSRANTIGFKVQLEEGHGAVLVSRQGESPPGSGPKGQSLLLIQQEQQKRNANANFKPPTLGAERETAPSAEALVASAKTTANGNIRLPSRSSISSSAAAIFGLAAGRATSSLRLQLRQPSGNLGVGSAAASATITSGGSTTGSEAAAAEYETTSRLPSGSIRQLNYATDHKQPQQPARNNNNLQQPQLHRPLRLSTKTTSSSITTTTTTHYEPQRRHIHASAVPQTNTKALVTTLLILGTYFMSYVPAIIVQVLTCIDNCPYPLYDIPFSRRVLLGTMTTLLLIAKSVIDPFIYSYRMGEIQMAINRYLSKRRSKNSSYVGTSLHTSQRFTNTCGAASLAGGATTVADYGQSNHNHYRDHKHSYNHRKSNNISSKKANHHNNQHASQAGSTSNNNNNNNSSFKLFSSSTNTSFRGSVFSRTTSVFSRSHNTATANHHNQGLGLQETTSSKLLQQQQTDANHVEHQIEHQNRHKQSYDGRQHHNKTEQVHHCKKAYSSSSSSSAATATTTTTASSVRSSNCHMTTKQQVQTQDGGGANWAKDQPTRVRLNESMQSSGQVDASMDNDDGYCSTSRKLYAHTRGEGMKNDTDQLRQYTVSEYKCETNDNHQWIGPRRPMISQRITFDFSQDDPKLAPRGADLVPSAVIPQQRNQTAELQPEQPLAS